MLPDEIQNTPANPTPMRPRVVPAIGAQSRPATLDVALVADRIAASVATAVVGKRAEVELLLIALLAGGHALIEDVPGTGKTLLARSLAAALGTGFQRIQFTPDMLPADITGISVYDPRMASFTFHPGPVFGHIVLADEINRATPRTQSALLEAMAEGQVTNDGVTRPLPDPFLVIATQNTLGSEGTYPLPTAQLDRFLLHFKMGYPSADEERQILRLGGEAAAHAVSPVLDADDVVALAARVADVHVADGVADYIVRIARATREHPDIALGASPRAAMGLFRAAQARAALAGRDFVTPDDVKSLAGPVLAHRLIRRSGTAARGLTATALVEAITSALPVDATMEPTAPPIASRARPGAMGMLARGRGR